MLSKNKGQKFVSVSSPGYFLFFLPVALLIFHFSRKKYGAAAGVCALVGLSALFLILNWPRYVVPFLSVVVLNYLFARALRDRGRLILGLALAFNLLVLALFRGEVSGQENLTSREVIETAGGSFFLFRQVGVLLDIYRGRVRAVDFFEYLAFSLFFPVFLAGPLSRFSDFSQQVNGPSFIQIKWSRFYCGLMLAAFGLLKKTIIANSLRDAVGMYYAYAGQIALTQGDAWLALVGGSLGLYFDFSGYSDIAIGVALLFGIRVPENFNSPARSLNVGEFWRRWHITVSLFIRDNFYGPLIRVWGDSHLWATVVLFLSAFLVAGWHGGSWNYWALGAYHGGALAIWMAWTGVVSRNGITWTQSVPWRLFSRILTSITVTVPHFLFEMRDFEGAKRFFLSLVGRGEGDSANISSLSYGQPVVVWAVVALSLVVHFAPNSQEVVFGGFFNRRIEWFLARKYKGWLVPIVVGVVTAVGVLLMRIDRGYLYARF